MKVFYRVIPRFPTIVFAIWNTFLLVPIILLLGASDIGVHVNPYNHPGYSWLLYLSFVFVILCLVPSWLGEMQFGPIAACVTDAIVGSVFLIIGLLSGRSDLFPEVHQIFLFSSFVVLSIFVFELLGLLVSCRLELGKYWIIFIQPLVFFPLWSFINIAIVEHGAYTAAAGKPFCIMAPTSQFGDYKVVDSLTKLNGFNLFTVPTNAGGTHDLAWTFHALLSVKDGIASLYYNWSYDAQRFEPISDDHLKRFRFKDEIEHACKLKQAGSCCL